MQALHCDLDIFYSLLAELANVPHQGQRLASYTGRMIWPKRGVYFFCEPHEFRNSSLGVARVVRVGTHALEIGSQAKLWERLRMHRGRLNGGGNHRGSVFRLHVGAAMLARDGATLATWGRGSSAPPELRGSPLLQAAEAALERQVSAYIGNISVFWIEVADAPGPSSDRAFIERNAIALLSNRCHPNDPASSSWLGNHSPSCEIRGSALWNVDHVYGEYDHAFLSKLENYVKLTAAEAGR